MYCGFYNVNNVMSVKVLQYNDGRTCQETYYSFKRRIKTHLPFAGIIWSSPYSPR